MGNDTPFRKAVYHGHTLCAKMLIENGAEFNSKSDKNISPLHLAVFKGHVDCAALLLEKGIFEIQKQNTKNKNIILLFFLKGVPIDVADESGM